MAADVAVGMGAGRMEGGVAERVVAQRALVAEVARVGAAVLERGVAAATKCLDYRRHASHARTFHAVAPWHLLNRPT